MRDLPITSLVLWRFEQRSEEFAVFDLVNYKPAAFSY